MGIRTVGKREINELLGKKVIHIGDKDDLVGAFYLSPYHFNKEFVDYIRIKEDLRNEPKEFVVVISGICMYKRTNIVLNIVNDLVRNNDVETLIYYNDKIHK